MLYAEARNLIQSGDLIAVRTAHNMLGKVTQFFTRSVYTHVGLASWRGGRLYVAELNGGRNHLVPISQLTEFDVGACPVNLPAEAIEEGIDHWLATPIEYGFIALFVIGLLDWLRIDIFVHWRRIMVCTGWCVAVWEHLGWGEHSRMLSPRQLVALVPLRVSVTV